MIVPETMLSPISIICLAFACATVTVVEAVDWDWSTWSPMDSYVNRADDSYTWRLLETHRVDAGGDDGQNDTTVYILNMTSQTWKDETYSSTPVWSHHLTIAIPDNVTDYEHAFMWIGGGSNPSSPPSPDGDMFVMAAAAFGYETGSVGTYLRQIPNQPVFLPRSEDPSLRRTEDAIIAWTWRHFVDTNGTDPDILLRNPMTKAVVRAFDTVATFTKQQNTQFEITKFFPAGGSKRGWTTWTVGCVDKRVFAMAPVVLSVLKLRETISLHYRAYGGWSFAFGDYWRQNITQYLNDDIIDRMGEVVDPYSYRNRMTMPKIVIQATGDEFFLPDEPNVWFKDLIGPKYVWMVENTHHPMTFARLDIFNNLVSFYKTITKQYTLPEFNWNLAYDQENRRGTIDLFTPQQIPIRMTVWYAETADGLRGPARRDFRWAIASEETPGEVDFNPVIWAEDPSALVEVEARHWRATVAEPIEGWGGFFIEVVFANQDAEELVFTTELNVIPPTYPFEACSTPTECWGTIV
ncbi:unnamed protein product [Owenia fusiformis]|uniref:Uncharacterized protein n=1 Tax=Owenia fusiformis TaxID=6347 RepID=A0A8S4NPR4_OWEFU|nr:unnamed protein product [Owenia fusiformis]